MTDAELATLPEYDLADWVTVAVIDPVSGGVSLERAPAQPLSMRDTLDVTDEQGTRWFVFTDHEGHRWRCRLVKERR